MVAHLVSYSKSCFWHHVWCLLRSRWTLVRAYKQVTHTRRWGDVVSYRGFLRYGR